jgi:hypothetical protein
VATNKQKRRREKELRHEYVWADEEGNELDPEDVPVRDAEAAKRGRPARSAREPQAPSWRRTLKRGAIFAPIMFATVMLLSKDQTLAQQITQTAIIVVIFIPFSFLLDTVFWRSYKRRLERQRGTSGRRER